jgi:putative oxidoreductase
MLAVDMLVAYITADREALLSFLSDPDKFTAGAEYTLLFAGLLIFVFGPGLIALDTVIDRYFAKRL